MQTIKQPYEVAISTYDCAGSSSTLDLIVMMLKHEYTLFLRKQSDSNYFIQYAIRGTSNIDRSSTWPLRMVFLVISA